MKFAWSMGFTEERVIRETEILFAGTGDRNHCHNGDTGSQFFKERDQVGIINVHNKNGVDVSDVEPLHI